MLNASSQVHVLRDPTRGGLATTLNEIATQSNVGIVLNEEHIPVRPDVAAACEMLGFDPLYVANEGKLVAIVAREDAEFVLQAMRTTRYGEDAVIIGEVTANPRGTRVTQDHTWQHTDRRYAGRRDAAKDLLIAFSNYGCIEAGKGNLYPLFL